MLKAILGSDWRVWFRPVLLSGFLVPALLLAACGAPATPTPAPPPTSAAQATQPAKTAAEAKPTAAPAAKEPDLYEAAKKEGKVVWYTAMNQSDAQALVDAFTKKYPGIQVELYRASGEEVLQRLVAETKAGKYLADINSSDAMREMMNEKLLAKYDSPERAAYPKELKDADGYWTTTSMLVFIFAYNTNNIKAAEVPKSYDDLGDPKWKGRLSTEEDAWDWLGALFLAQGEDKTVAQMQKFAANQPKRIKGFSTQLQQIVIGEVDGAIVHLHSYLGQKQKGAPINFVALEPVIASGHNIALQANAPHPNAGKLLLNFILSVDGQKVLGDLGRIPGRPGAPNSIDKALPNAKVFYAIGKDLPKTQTALSDQYHGIFFK